MMLQGHVHFASLPGMWDRTLTVSSAGKTFSVTGWQVRPATTPSSYLSTLHRTQRRRMLTSHALRILVMIRWGG